MSHAPLAPSDAAGWIRCAAKVRAARDIEEKDSVFSYEGTVMHEFRSECLTKRIDPLSFAGELARANGGPLLRVSFEMVNHLVEGIDRIYDLCGGDTYAKAEGVMIEVKLFFSQRELCDVYGTLDFGALIEGEELVLSDLKFGAGKAVSPYRNEQQLIYGLLYYDNLTDAQRRKVRRIRVIIDQPRIDGAGGEWVVPIETVLRWRDNTLYPAVEATNARRPKFNPGPIQCYWCKARPTCTAHAEYMADVMALQFDDERDYKTLKSAPALSPARKAYLLDHEGMIRAHLADVAATVLDDAQKGRETPGRKVVMASSGHRSWADETRAERVLRKLLGDKATKAKVLSPAQAESALPKNLHKEFRALIVPPPKVPKLVNIDDDRPASETTIKFQDER